MAGEGGPHTGRWRRIDMVQRASASLEQINPKETSTKEARRAGSGTDTSFMRSLCMGYIEEDMLLPFPAMSAEQRETLQGVVSSLGDLLGPKEKDFRAWDKAGEMPRSYID